jgi:hypothetical protein
LWRLIRDLSQGRAAGAERSIERCLACPGRAAAGSNQFGAFASDTLMKLGLLGTIIGSS